MVHGLNGKKKQRRLLKMVFEKTTHWFKVPSKSIRKDAHLFVELNPSSRSMRDDFSEFTLTDDQNTRRLKAFYNYLLGLSMSSIAANSFCLAFLLMWEPRQTFTRFVNCLVEYSWPKKVNHFLVSRKQAKKNKSIVKRNSHFSLSPVTSPPPKKKEILKVMCGYYLWLCSSCRRVFCYKYGRW